MKHRLHILNTEQHLEVPAGTDLLSALRSAGLSPEAPCGGHGTCGK